MNAVANHLIQEIKTIARTHHFDQDIEMINGYAGISPISVQPELYTLILKSIRLKELTGGVFDIFNTSDKSGHQVEVNPLLLSVYLPFSEMEISLGPIAELGIN